MSTQSNDYQNQRPSGSVKRWPRAATGSHPGSVELLESEECDLDTETVEAMLAATAAKATIV